MTHALYIWIPRNGGTSIHTRMSEASFVRLKPFGREYHYDKCHFTMIGHHTLEDALAAGILKQQRVVIATIRNPWSRMVSLYRYWRGRLGGRLTFKDFVNLAIDDPQGTTPIKGVVSVGHASPQYDWITINGEIPRNLSLIRFEMIQAGWHTVSEAIGITWKGLSRQNASGEPEDYRVYYDDATLAAIAQRYDRDITIGGYTFE